MALRCSGATSQGAPNINFLFTAIKKDLKLSSNWYILTKGMLKYYMDAKYHKAANVVSGCEANPNLDSLIKYKNVFLQFLQ